MSEPSQSTIPNVLPQLQHAPPPQKPISANTEFTDIFSRLDQQQRNASKPIKASVKAASEQPSVAMLAGLGIKVRDFAYESKLPPIPPIYRHPRQIQPAVVRTGLKRQWRESGGHDPSSQSSSQPESSQKKLERTSTEPAILTEIDDYEHDSLHTDSQRPDIYPESQQMPPSIIESQESEPYIDTPLVTPRGSLQWPVPYTSNISTFQLDTESQGVAPKHSPLTISQISDTSFRKRPTTSTATPLAPALSTASTDDELGTETIHSTPSRPPRGKAAARPEQRPQAAVDATHEVHAPTSPRMVAVRYHLRKRPVASSLPFSPPKTSSRLHNLRPRGAPIPPSTRPHCASIQSSHSRAKPKGDTGGSPSSRALLRRAVTNGQGKRMRTS